MRSEEAPKRRLKDLKGLEEGSSGEIQSRGRKSEKRAGSHGGRGGQHERDVSWSHEALAGREMRFQFVGEDHTLGNSLRYMLMKDPKVEFAGYTARDQITEPLGR